MVWGCMAASGIGEMFVCEGRLNSTAYINVLKEALLPSFAAVFGDTNMDGVKFQQDNAPCHKSGQTMKWFKDNDIETLNWPPQSPDLNPIEHLWGILKHNIRKYSITSKDMLRRRLKEEWNNISTKECQTLVNSMPKRVAAVIKAKGGPTKY